MDFRKVIDQAVREIKREVNIKVLKVPEIEQKVLDATSDEPWGPHGADLAEIAQATKKFADCYMVMNVLWTRLNASDRNWRQVYKALAVVEYLIANGSERAVDDILEHTYQISSLSGYEYIEPNGRDAGLNVRKRTEAILALLSNKDKIEEVRKKAAMNHDKYFGLSSTGITYKSSAASYGGIGIRRNECYDRSDNSKSALYSGRQQDAGKCSRDASIKSHLETDKSCQGISKKEKKHTASPLHIHGTLLKSTGDAAPVLHQNSNSLNEDNLDDFDPRGSSQSDKHSIRKEGSSILEKPVDLFCGSLIDLMDAPSVSTERAKPNIMLFPEVVETVSVSTERAKPNISLFPEVNESVSVSIERANPNLSLFSEVDKLVSVSTGRAIPDSSLFHEVNATERIIKSSTLSPNVDVSTSVSMERTTSNNALFSGADSPSSVSTERVISSHNLSPGCDLFAGVDFVSAPAKEVIFQSQANDDLFAQQTSTCSTGLMTLTSLSAEKKPSPSKQAENYSWDPFSGVNNLAASDSFGEFVSNNLNGTDTSGAQKKMQERITLSKPQVKEDILKVRSGIWADSLNRGLIDLNISSAKKTSLTDIGVLGLDGSDENGTASAYKRMIVGVGSGVGK